jgi:hypothetical protein
MVHLPDGKLTTIEHDRGPDGGVLSDNLPGLSPEALVYTRAFYGGSLNSMRTALQVVRYDRATGQEQLISAPNVDLANPGDPTVVDGRWAVYAVGSGIYGADLWVWDATTGTATPRALPGTDERAPSLRGDWLAWERRESGLPSAPSEIRAVNLKDGRVAWPSEGLGGSNVAPAVDAGHVVWHREWTEGSVKHFELYHYDLETGVRRRLDGIEAFLPRIHGSLVCAGGGPANPGTWIIDVASGRMKRLSPVTAYPGWRTACDVWGRRVVWLEYSLIGSAYLRELEDNEP